MFNFDEISMIDKVPKKDPVKVEDFRINKIMATGPIGLKCWPSVSIFIKQTKVSLILSRLIDHVCNILFFPYSNYYLTLYPGNIINQSPFDYKNKLKSSAK